MEKKYQVIYIWSFIVVFGIILLMLYTPLGGSSLYKSGNRDQVFVASTLYFGDGIKSHRQNRSSTDSTDFRDVDFNATPSLKLSRINNSTSRATNKYSGRGNFFKNTTNNYVYTGNKEVRRYTQQGALGGSASSSSYNKRNSTDRNENLAMNFSFGERSFGGGLFGAQSSSNHNIEKATAALGTTLFDLEGSTATYTSGGPLAAPTSTLETPVGDGTFILIVLLSLYVALMVKRKLRFESRTCGCS